MFSFYYICAEDGQVVRVRCFCGTVFDMRQQTCVSPEQLTVLGCTNYYNVDVKMCGDDCILYFYENFDKFFGENSKITKEDVKNFLKIKE